MIIVIRLLFILGCTLYGYFSNAAWLSLVSLPASPAVGAGLGLILGGLIVTLDLCFKQFSVRNLLAAALGAGLGIVLHRLVMSVFQYVPVPESFITPIGFVTLIVLAYLGAVTLVRGQDEFTTMIPFVTLDTKGPSEELIVLDTSVIIDGRIADICKTHFLSSKLILPRFVLKELQLISDSSDPLKRNRGRRGLDILNKVKADPNVQVTIHEMDFPELTTVDAKLVKMGQVLNAKVFTNDYNLNKVAELQGVKVLNINELANALKPIVMPGEVMHVKVLKEGKEHDQGVAYLDDGTMVVVDNGRRRMGHTLDVTITSVLQTQAGRMIFAKPSDEGERHERGGRHDRPRHDYPRRPPQNQAAPAPQKLPSP